MAVAAGLFLVAGTAEAAKEIRVSLGVGPKHPIAANGWVPYTEAVEKASNGELKFKIFVGGQLFSLTATLAGVRDNIADAANFGLTYWPAELPNSKLVGDLALLGQDAATMAGAATEYYFLNCADCQAEFAAQGFVYNGGDSTTPFVILSRGKITTVDDIKGKKVRVGGSGWARWVERFGAATLSTTGAEMYQAFAQGAINAALQGPSALTAFGLQDVVTDITMLPLGTYHALALIGYNKRTWTGFTEQERRILLDHGALATSGVVVGYINQDKDVLADAARRNVRVHQPSPELTKATEAFIQGDLKRVIEDNGKNGVTDAARKVARFQELIAKWSALTAPIKDDRKKLDALYKSEIFSKVDARTYGL